MAAIIKKTPKIKTSEKESNKKLAQAPVAKKSVSRKAKPKIIEAAKPIKQLETVSPPVSPLTSVSPVYQRAYAKPSGTQPAPVAKVRVEPASPRLQRGERYFEALGSRKRATARVRLYTSNPANSAEAGNIEVNLKPYKTYFPGERLQLIVEDPLRKLKSMNRFRATVRVAGGGTHAQAEAVAHGLARTLTLFDQNFRKRLKRAGLLKRDPREKERKKYGLKKARRAPQWAKR